MTLDKAEDKIREIIKEIENDGFEISLISEISCCSNGIKGSCIVSHNEEYLENEIMTNLEEEKRWIGIKKR